MDVVLQKNDAYSFSISLFVEIMNVFSLLVVLFVEEQLEEKKNI